jgi:predicted lipoprotein with Yx(FWY)xxD motif
VKRMIAVSALAVSGALAIAACGGTAGASGGSSAASASSHTVSAKQVGGVGKVLVDSHGQALYSPTQEAHGKIVCTGSCTSIWKPLKATGTLRPGPGVGKLKSVKRPDGTRQVSAAGHPLYTFVEDKSGSVKGNGASDSFGGHSFKWHVVLGGGKLASGSAQSSSPAPTNTTPSNTGPYGGGGY